MRLKKTEEPNVYLNDFGYFIFRKGTFEKSLGTKNFKEAVRAKKVLEKRRAVFGDHAFTLKLADTYAEHLPDRVREAENDEIRLGTLKEFRSMFEKHILPHLGKKRLNQIDSRAFSDLVTKLDLGDVTNVRKVLGVHLRWCAKHNYITAIPILDVPTPKRRPRRILTKDEILAIFSHARGPLLLFLSFALFMGMRRSEIMRLSFTKHVDLAKRSVRLKAEDTKTRQERVIPVNFRVVVLLMERLEMKITSQWVFPNKKDSRRHMDVAGLRKQWLRCLKDAGLGDQDITWHDFRATHEAYAHKRPDFTATQLEKFFGSSVDVQRKIYVKMSADDLRGIEEAVEIQGLSEAMGISREVRCLIKPNNGDKS